MQKSEVSFLQSDSWAKFQRALGREVIQKSGAEFSYLAIVEHGRLSNRLYCPYGPTVESANGLKAALDDLKNEAKKRRLDFVRVEPFGNLTEINLTKFGLKRARKNVNPENTIISDVSVSEDEIRAALSQTARRYARKCDKAGITYSVSYQPTDIKYFTQMIHSVAARTGMNPYDDLYFQNLAGALFPTKSAGLLLADLDGKKIASIIFFTNGRTMSYAHAGNLTEYRKFSPATGLGLFALLFAHQIGCKKFDWHGVAPDGSADNPKWKSWQGFTNFKLSFGGRRVDRLGTWELPVRPLRYRILRGLLRLARR
ncbi:MAG: aminoacyltransferase [Candidatus Nomurabacteria bacterium]|jgi:lipid II:glycine glycyltransferase (peptidoglycan interpeptide bridge formation enzyme)|nr:aminoacyltransferase [Candidatus Nomurabacteria bacterium]